MATAQPEPPDEDFRTPNQSPTASGLSEAQRSGGQGSTGATPQLDRIPLPDGFETFTIPVLQGILKEHDLPWTAPRKAILAERVRDHFENPSIHCLGRPNLQKVHETLLPGARLRAFSKLFLDLASFFQSEVV